MARMTSLLCFTGVLLFLLGLLTGFAIPALKAPRIGLSAHLAATQMGVALIAFGFLWERLTFWNGWSAPLAHVLWISFYIVWAAILLGGIWGTGRALPIAGAGHVAAKWQEQITLLPLALGSFGGLGVIVMLLIQWKWKA
ncbi:MAG: hydrogenase, partial [Rhizomicrobium sp.]